jgi:hypothetical protein
MGYNIKQNADGSTSLVNGVDSVEVLKLDPDGDVVVTKSSGSTSGSSSVQPFQMLSTMTGAGGVGGRGYFKLNADAALGGWSNALKGEVVYDASGSTSGLGSAVLAEMQLSAGTTSGTYAPLELELGIATGAKTGTQTALIYANTYGDDKSEFDDNGVILDLNGVSGGDDKAFGTFSQQASPAFQAALKIKVGGTVWYVPLADTKNLAA